MSDAQQPSGDVKRSEAARWNAKVKVDRFRPGVDIDEYRRLYGKEEGERRFHAEAEVEESIEVDGNILVTAGIGLMLDLLIGAGGTVYSNANAYLGVGDDNTAASAGQTNLQAATNAYRQAMDSTYPSRSTNVLTFKATFGTSVGNFHWQEWAIFNGAGTGTPPTGATMLNRKVADLGTKTSAASWALTVTVTIN